MRGKARVREKARGKGVGVERTRVRMRAGVSGSHTLYSDWDRWGLTYIVYSTPYSIGESSI